jgi:hypothetical protein
MRAMARGRFLLSLPERTVRAFVAVLGGSAYEASSLVLPRLVRRSRLYEATAKNLLRVLVEGVGAVKGGPTEEPDAPPPGEVVKRKVAGNVVELGSIAAFGFSPLWLLAAASDVVHGSRAYLDVLVQELKQEGVLAEKASFATFDDLMGALEGGAGTSARLIDMPPLELDALRETVADFRSHAADLPSPGELAAVYGSLREAAERERKPLLEVSTGVGLAFLTATRSVGREHLAKPYAEDWKPLREEGFAAYARRIAGPYRRAVAEHFDTERPTYTERALGRLARDV